MEKIKVSVTGFGFIGRYHTIAYRNLPLCYSNFPYEIELHRLLTSKDIKNSTTGFSQHVKCIDDLKGSDLIDICTPNFIHAPEIKRAAELGIKNIYCEKPVTGVYEEEESLAGFVKINNITNQVALMIRFLPAAIRARKMIEDGMIGRVINFNCHMLHQGYLDPERPMAWRLSKEKSAGGALVDLGIHMIDLTRFLLGDFDKVRTYTTTVINKRPSGEGISNVDVDDFAHIDIILKRGASGTIEVSRMAAGKGEDTAIEIFGTLGSIKVDVKSPDWPSVYILKDNAWVNGNFIKYDDIEEDINTLLPAAKFSLGWMMNAHMASIYSFLMKMKGSSPKYVRAADFSDSAAACRILDASYNSAKMDGEFVTV